MTLEITHPFVSTRAARADSTLVGSSQWNAGHSILLQGPAVVGRAAGTSGVAAEIQATSGTGYALRESAGEIAFGTLGTSGIADSAVTAQKIAAGAVLPSALSNLSSSNRVLGRFTSGSGSVEELQLVSGRGGLVLSGSNLIRDALTGDITSASGSSQTSIITGAVTYAKMQFVSASQFVLGRQTVGAGIVEEVTASNILRWISSTSDRLFGADSNGQPIGVSVVGAAIALSNGVLSVDGTVNGLAGLSTSDGDLVVAIGVDSFSTINRQVSSSVFYLGNQGTSNRPAYRRVQVADLANVGVSNVLFGTDSVGVGTSIAVVGAGIGLSANNLVLDNTLNQLAGVAATSNELIYASAADTYSNLRIDTQTLSIVGGALLRAALTGDVIGASGSSTLTISAGVVTYAKIQNLSTSQVVLGRNTAGAGSVAEISIHNQLDWVGTTVGDILYKSTSNAWARITPGTSGQYLASQSVGVAPKFVTLPGGAAAATQAEQEAGTDTAPYTSPARQHFHPSAPKAWVTFSGVGASTSVISSYNVTSVTRNASGDYTITFTNPFSTSNYGWNINCGGVGGLHAYIGSGPFSGVATSAAFRMFSVRIISPGTVQLVDTEMASVSFFGDLP